MLLFFLPQRQQQTKIIVDQIQTVALIYPELFRQDSECIDCLKKIRPAIMGGFFSGSLTNFVDDHAPDRLTSIGFHANMFIEYDWAALKTFCNKRNISQTQLNLMFRKFLTYKNVHLNEFKVRLDDIKSYFLKETRITMVGTYNVSLLLSSL